MPSTRGKAEMAREYFKEGPPCLLTPTGSQELLCGKRMRNLGETEF